MNWFKLFKFSQNILNLNSGDSIQDNIYRIYEIEYKLFALKNKPNKMHPNRFYNIKNYLESKFKESAIIAKEQFINLFKGWLGSHALLDPKQWAYMRIKGDIRDLPITEFEQSYEDKYLGIIYNEYLRYKDNSQYSNRNSYSNRNLDKIFIKEIITNIEKFPQLNIFAERYSRDYNISNPTEDEKDETNFSFEDIVDMRITTVEELGELLDYYLDGDEEFDFYVALNQYLVFPLWFAYWKAQGIEKVRDSVQNMYNKLLSMDVNNYGQTTQIINNAIQTVHMSGSVIEYFLEYTGENVDKEELDLLTEGFYVTQWDEDLKKIGVEV